MSDSKKYGRDHDVFAQDDAHEDHHVDHFSEGDAFSNETEELDAFGMTQTTEHDIYADDGNEAYHQEHAHNDEQALYEEGYPEHSEYQEGNHFAPIDGIVPDDDQAHLAGQAHQQAGQFEQKKSSKLKAAIAVGLFGIVAGGASLFFLGGDLGGSSAPMITQHVEPEPQFGFSAPQVTNPQVQQMAAQLDPDALQRMDAAVYVEEADDFGMGGAQSNPLAVLGGSTPASQVAPSDLMDTPVSHSFPDPNVQVSAGMDTVMNQNVAVPVANNVDSVSQGGTISIQSASEAGSVMDLVNTLTGYVDNNSLRINEVERRLADTELRISTLKEEIVAEISSVQTTTAQSASSGVNGAERSSAPVQRQAPPQDGFYTIAAGDTLSSIASRFGQDLSTLASNNGIANAAVIFAGQRIRVDGGKLSDEEIQRNRARTQTASTVASRSNAPSRSAGGSGLSNRWKIAGLSPTRAVLIDSSGQYHTVAVGQSLAGGGIVEQIDVAGNRVVTSSGVIQFIH